MGNIYVSVTVDWEGEHFRNIDELVAARIEIEKAVGQAVPFTHYICPNYWLNKSPTPKQNIEKVWNKGLDEIGLHIHCWKELIAHASLGFRYDSTLDWDNNGTGHGIPLGVYPKSSIETILTTSRELLAEKLELPSVPGFRCGGWMTCDTVFDALMATGFAYDCSAVPPAFFSQGFSRSSQGDFNATDNASAGDIAKLLTKIWGYDRQFQEACLGNALSLRWNANEAIVPETQPYKVFKDSKSIIELPNNGGLSDYVISSVMGQLLNTIAILSERTDEPVFLNVGCRLEGGTEWKKPLVDFFKGSKSVIKKLMSAGRLDFTTVLSASKSADLYMVD